MPNPAPAPGAAGCRGALALAAVVTGGLLMTACGDGPTSPSATGSNLRLMLTDAPAGVDQVQIYFTGVTAKPVGRSVERLALEIPDNPVDLLTLDDRVIGFAAGAVDPGEYEFIHIDIDEDRSYLVERGERKRLQIPSEEIKVVGGFTIDDDHVTTLTLDFDADKSLLRLGNGGWLMRPVVVITGNDTSSRRNP
jgi:hypothetical protein